MRRVDYMVGSRDFTTLLAEQFMQSAVISFHKDDPAEKLAMAMTDGGFGSVPIVEHDRKLVGIVSEFDLLKVIMEEKSLATVLAGDIMTPTPITVLPDTPAMDIVHLLEEKHLIRMPVVDSKDTLVGIVARRDILEGYLQASTPLRGF